MNHNISSHYGSCIITMTNNVSRRYIWINWRVEPNYNNLAANPSQKLIASILVYNISCTWKNRVEILLMILRHITGKMPMSNMFEVSKKCVDVFPFAEKTPCVKLSIMSRRIASLKLQIWAQLEESHKASGVERSITCFIFEITI